MNPNKKFNPITAKILTTGLFILPLLPLFVFLNPSLSHFLEIDWERRMNVIQPPSQ